MNVSNRTVNLHGWQRTKDLPKMSRPPQRRSMACFVQTQSPDLLRERTRQKSSKKS